MAVFTYGQTSSGKTHTMKGDEKDPGLIPRTLKKLFEILDSKSDKRYMVAKMSYFEIYNESINDLLDGSKTNLDIRLDKEQHHHIPNITWVEAIDYKQAMQQL